MISPYGLLIGSVEYAEAILSNNQELKEEFEKRFDFLEEINVDQIIAWFKERKIYL